MKGRHKLGSPTSPQRNTTQLASIELRRQIAIHVNPLRKIMRIAQGLRINGMRRRPEPGEILGANYKLLDKFLPDLKSVELSETPGDVAEGRAQILKDIMEELSRDIAPKKRSHS